MLNPLQFGMDCNSTEGPASDHNLYLDKFLFMVYLAYQKVRAMKALTIVNPIHFLYASPFFVSFAVFLLCRYANQILLYQVLFCVSVIIPLLFYIYMYHVPFLFLEEDIKWIQKESRLLHAISEDAAKVVELRDHIETRAQQILDPSIYSGGVNIKGLNEVEAAWVSKTISLVQKAEGLVATFKNLRRRDSQMFRRICFGTVCKNFLQIEVLFTETKRVKKEINDSILTMKMNGINICESLERSNSKLRSLLDRPVEQNWVGAERRVASASALTFDMVQDIKRLITQNPDLMRDSTGEQTVSINLQLLLLHPLMKDLEGTRFESEIEEAWVDEVEEVINEAHLAIENFFQRRAFRITWLSFVSSWQARRKLKGAIKCTEAGFSDLLDRKERYGFKFIRRGSSKTVIYQSPSHTIDDFKIISSVVERMRYYLNQESGVFSQVSNEVTSLRNQLGLTHKLLDDAVISEGRNNSRMALLEQMKKIVQSAEESLETFLKNSDAVWRHYLSNTRAGQNLFHEIDRINRTTNLLLRCIRAYGTESRDKLSSVVGLEKDICSVVSQLTTNRESGSVISIVGVEGIGKTTLAKKFFYHGDVMSHFPRRVWISLPWKSNASWVKKVYDMVGEERYLLVLDNISTGDELDTAVKADFPVTSSGSKILFTTRHSHLASEGGSPPYQLRLRTKEESWKLFIQMVHVLDKEEIQAKEILGKCGGLPLGIIRLGYLMAEKDVSSAEELERVTIQNDIKPLLQTYTMESIKRLLPHHQIMLLSYLKLFPTEFEIPSRRLIALWIAEGLVQVGNNEIETYEDVAEKYLSDLIDCGMIQVVRRKPNGIVKTCCLPDALQVLRWEAMTSTDEYRLTDHLNINDPSFVLIHGEGSTFPNRDLCSFLSFDTREGFKPGQEIGYFLRRGIAGGYFERLQVLDLEHVLTPELPNTIGRLSKLKYVGLRWTYLEKIPPSIGDLLNLQTLDVKHTYINLLPSSIWKLHKLRHLYLNKSCRSKFMGRPRSGQIFLKNLQTLWGVFMDKNSPLIDELGKLINLRKLGLAFKLDPSKQKAVTECIGKLKHLKCLRMRSIGEMGEPCDLICMTLSGLENLSSLNLFGKLTPSIMVELPKNLTNLTLSASFLSDDPMPKLEKLSNLKSLCFHSNSYTGEKMTCSSWGFPQLLVLKLWKLQQLQDWDVEEKAMQNLMELEIRSCTNLKVPIGFRHLKTVTELKLTNMPEEFAVTVAQIWDDVNHSPEIIRETW